MVLSSGQLSTVAESWAVDPSILKHHLPSLTLFSMLIRPVVTDTALTPPTHITDALVAQVEQKQVHCPLNSVKSMRLGNRHQ